jgi:hypothetical protein
MERFINIGLLSNPINWIIVLSMVSLGGMAVHLIFYDGQGA